jgi:glycosyltransferase involved in cell wall biosynthesis
MPKTDTNTMRFIAVQRGARRSYAVPLILAQSGMLECFYTDICGNVGLGKVLACGRALPMVEPALARLANRRVPGDVIAQTRTFPGAWILGGLKSVLGRKDPESQFRRHLDATEAWGRSMASAGFGRATHVYSMLSEGGPYLRAARRAGLKVVAEVYILLSTERILEAERKRFPDWEPDRPNWPELRARLDKANYLINEVDEYICPSDAVRQDLIENWGVEAGRCHLVPYGMAPHWLDIEPKPVPGRVLFVGTAELRKGIHYLAQAAEILRQRGRRYEFRVAGQVSESVRSQPACRHLTFLGRVPRSQVHMEFQQAAVFALPSLAEGSAEVTYEALAASVPLVTTQAAGSVARDGIEGRIVPERDPVALTDAIEEIMENHALRERMAKAARERAREYTWDGYGERLINTLMSLPK